MGSREERARALVRKFAFRDDNDSLPIVVEVGEELFDAHLSELTESRTKMVNGLPVRKDSPHFQGDQTHATITLAGGKEVTWNRSGSRRHPNKFPADVSPKWKAAIAKVLDVLPDILEWREVRSEGTGESYLLVEKKSALKQLAETILKVHADKKK
jgi:hypothetical protein